MLNVLMVDDSDFKIDTIKSVMLFVGYSVDIKNKVYSALGLKEDC